MTATAPTGICQHCKQPRPLFLHEGELEMWGYNPADAAWLCAPAWSRRDQAVDNGRDIAIHRNFRIWPEPTPSA